MIFNIISHLCHFWAFLQPYLPAPGASAGEAE
jgi:hypothetical protein